MTTSSRPPTAGIPARGDVRVPPAVRRPGGPGPGDGALPDHDPAVPGRAPRAAGGISRISVLAPATRVDVALPADVPVAELLGVLADMAGEPPDPDAPAPAAWTLAPLGAAAVDPARTLADLGVLDGDQLVLRRRAAAAAAPLYDDVADAVAGATGPSWRPWDAAVARRLGLVGLGAGVAVAVVLLVAAGRGPGTGGGVLTAVVAATAALLGAGLGAALARAGGRPAVGAVAALGGAVCAAVAAVAALPARDRAAVDGATSLVAGAGPGHLLLGAAVLALAAGVTPTVLGRGARGAVVVSVALTALGLLATLTGVGAVVAEALAPPGGGPDTAAVAAGAGALAVAALSVLPRAGLALARLPVPRIPSSAEELAAEPDPDPADEDVAERTDRAHAVLSGLLTGCAAVVAVAVGVLVAAVPPGGRGVAALGLAALLTALLAARARTYANAVHAAVLLAGAVVAGAAALLAAVAVGAGGVLLAAAGLALAGGALAAVLGTAAAGRRASPVTRRTVEGAEAVAIVAVLPLAFAVMDLYRAAALR